MASPASPIAATFGRNLATARKRSGFSQEEVAVRASLHRTEIGLLERGERMPRIDTAIKLAGAVSVPVAALLEGIEWTPGLTRPGAFVTGGSRSD
ncbi:MAG TPA: helix-turn-helix transcriptional regulator [Sphingomicrobium sp.]|nr:helix-turn-helix transcriptional regulator [Sphingomicrobium sp.]